MTNRAGFASVLCVVGLLMPAIAAAEEPAASAAIPPPPATPLVVHPPSPPASPARTSGTDSRHARLPQAASAGATPSATKTPATPGSKTPSAAPAGKAATTAKASPAAAKSAAKGGGAKTVEADIRREDRANKEAAQRPTRHRDGERRHIVGPLEPPRFAAPPRYYAEAPPPPEAAPIPYPPPWYDRGRPMTAFAYPPFAGPRGPGPWWGLR